MLPITVDPKFAKVGLIGSGDAYERRAALLRDSGVGPIVMSPEGDLAGLTILFVAGVAPETAAALAQRARAAQVLVNVEDVPEFCDFHVPAIVRRGDLLLTASTGGRAPGLSRLLRGWLGRAFGPEWQDRMEDVSRARSGWRAEGLPPDQVSRRTTDYVAERGWLS